MAQSSARPKLELRLSGKDKRQGEIPLTDLAKIVEQTQLVVSRLARGLIDRPPSGRPRKSMAEATKLYLIGVHAGSTVLEIAGPELDPNVLEDMPAELSEMALAILLDSLEALTQPEPTLPVGVDTRVAASLDRWLRSLSGYEQVSVNADLSSGHRQAAIRPRSARSSLERAESQPLLPFVSADHRSLTGRLYALNLRTGSFSIEDDAGHSIRLTVPEDLRAEAAQLVDTRVRALGSATFDDRHRLVTFELNVLEPQPSGLLATSQGKFFESHEELRSQTLTGRLEAGIIRDLTDDEIDAFVAAFETE